MEQSQTRLHFLDKIVKQKWCKNLDRYLQQTNRLKTTCPIYVKPPMAFFDEYTVFSCQKNMFHC